MFSLRHKASPFFFQAVRHISRKQPMTPMQATERLALQNALNNQSAVNALIADIGEINKSVQIDILRYLNIAKLNQAISNTVFPQPGLSLIISDKELELVKKTQHEHMAKIKLAPEKPAFSLTEGKESEKLSDFLAFMVCPSVALFNLYDGALSLVAPASVMLLTLIHYNTIRKYNWERIDAEVNPILKSQFILKLEKLPSKQQEEVRVHLSKVLNFELDLTPLENDQAFDHELEEQVDQSDSSMRP